jgi:hypothetical protein
MVTAHARCLSSYQNFADLADHMKTMKPPSNSQKPNSLFEISLAVSSICTFAGSVLLMVEANVALRIESLFTGKHVYSDPTTLPFVLIFSCMALFIPVVLGVILLIVFLRYLLRKGRLTPKTGILSGMGIWALGGILFCLLLILSDPFPLEPSLGPRNFWTLIPQIFDDGILSGIIIACLLGGWAGHVFTKKILFAQQFPLAEQ